VRSISKDLIRWRFVSQMEMSSAVPVRSTVTAMTGKTSALGSEISATVERPARAMTTAQTAIVVKTRRCS